MSTTTSHYDHLPFGVYRTTRDGRIVAANRTMLEMLGYSDLSELAERDLETHPHTSYRRATFRDLLERFGEIRGLDAAWTRRDGSVIYAREHVRAIRNGTGEIEFFEGVVENLAGPGAEHRPLAGFGLHRVVAPDDAILAVDEAGHVVTANEMLLRMWGFRRAPESLADALAHIEQQLANESARELRASTHRDGAGAQVTLQDRHGRNVALFTWEQRAGGAGLGRVFSFRDVTDEDASATVQRRLVPMQDLLARAARTLFSAADATAFLCRVTSAACDATKATYALALFTTPDEGVLRVECVKHPKVCGLVPNQLLSAGKAVRSLMRSGHAGIVGSEELGLQIEVGEPAICIAPLVVDGRTTGVLCLGVRDRASLFTDDLGMLAAFATIAAIAIDRWTNFARLGESEAKYRVVAELVSSIVYDFRVRPDGTFDPPLVLPALSEGGDPVRTVGSVAELESIAHPDSAGAVMLHWNQVQRGEQDIREYCLLTSRGNEFWVRDFARPFEHFGDGTVRVIGAAIDITESKLRERALRESSAALRRAEVLSAIGSIAAGVAHEVRGPLFGIAAALETIEERLDADELRPYFRTFQQELGRLSALMQDLLDYGRPSAVERVAAPLVEVVEAARRLCEKSARARGIDVDVQIDGAPDVVMDSSRMTQLFRNLIENAVQHSPPGEVVSVRVTSDAARDVVICRVADRGRGLTQEELDRAFEPFFTRRPGGTGLGLALVHRIAEQHHGAVTLSNGTGGGAVAEVILPLA